MFKGTVPNPANILPTISVPGRAYRVSFIYSIVSSYTNGNPWSVVLGGETLISGAGSSRAWASHTKDYTCTGTGNDVLQFRIRSNNNREARLLVDNVTVTAL